MLHNGSIENRVLSASPPPASGVSVPSDRLWLRSELMGTQVITRDTGRRLGVVGEVVVDIDRREVVALGLRDNPLTRFLPGLPRWMPLERIRQVGDVILVDSSDSLEEGFNPERYSKVINCQVITESGQTLGRVLGFSFDIETGELVTLVIGALGVPLLAEGVLSTWELPVAEVVSSGSDRIIVYEGAEQKLKQLGTGLLEKMGIGGNSWEKEERERWRMGPVPAENQLPAGLPGQQEPQRRIQPATARAFQPEEEMEYVELEDRRQREPLRQRRYLDEETPRDPYGSSDLEREPGGARFAPGQSGRSPDRELTPRANLGNGSVNAGPSWDRERQAEAWDPGDRDPGDRRSWERDLEERRPQDQGPARAQSRDRDPAEGRPWDQEPGERRSSDQEPGTRRSWNQEPGDRRASDQEAGERRSWDQEPEGRSWDQEPGERRSSDQETGMRRSWNQEPGDRRASDQEAGERRSWDQEPEGRSWDQEPGERRSSDQDTGMRRSWDQETRDRRPSDQEPGERRSWDQEAEGRLRDRGEEGPSRRSRAAEPPPLRRVDRAIAPELVDVAPEPVDVEPEILDDPW